MPLPTLILFALIMLLPISAISAMAAEDEVAEEAPAESRTMVDRSYQSVDNLVQNTVRRIDSFFVNEEHATFTDRKTRVRLRLNTDYIQHHGWEVSPKLKLNLVLPGLNDRLRLVVNDEPGSDVDQAAPNDDDNDVALRWIGRQNPKRGYSFDLGLRIKGGNLDPFGRINLGFEYPLAGDWIGQSQSSDFIAEKVRESLGRIIVREYCDEAGLLSVITVDPEIEQLFMEALSQYGETGGVSLPPEAADRFQNGLRREVEKSAQRGLQPVLLVSSPIRLVFKRFSETMLPGLAVLAYSEVPLGQEVKAIGMVKLHD